MKIIFLAGQDIVHRDSGVGARCRLFAQALARRHDVIALQFSEQRRPELRLEERLLLRSVYSRNGPGKAFHIPMLRQALLCALEYRPDLVVGSFISVGLYAWAAAAACGAPLVFDDHNSEFRLRRELGRGLLETAFCGIVERLCCIRSRAVFVVSKEDRRDLERWAAGKLFVMPNSFDERLFYPSAPASGQRTEILFFANFDYEPNQEAAHLIFERILPEVIRRRPDVVFRLVGRNGEFAFAHPSLEKVGPVEDIAAEIRRAALVIAPLLRGGGSRLKIVEALACGKTVVSTPKGAEGLASFRQLVTVPIEQFPERIGTLLERPQTQDAGESERLKRLYSLESLAEELDATLARLL